MQKSLNFLSSKKNDVYGSIGNYMASAESLTMYKKR